jgi:cytochrome P450
MTVADRVLKIRDKFLTALVAKLQDARPAPAAQCIRYLRGLFAYKRHAPGDDLCTRLMLASEHEGRCTKTS